MTNKISLEALKLAGFKNPNAIATIISYVPNPTVALEILLDIHEPLVVDQSKKFAKYKWGESLYEITRIDELGNKVFYKQYTQKTQLVYYKTKEDQQNKIYQLERPSSDRDYYNTGHIPVNGYAESEGAMDLEKWENDYKVMHPDLAFALLENWTNYGVFVEKDPTDLMLECH
jgi:hypothetical protein